ncbi:MAG: GMC family oxidoreductase N-terminal domain-containing protein [Actinomycetota bacterium]
MTRGDGPIMQEGDHLIDLSDESAEDLPTRDVRADLAELNDPLTRLTQSLSRVVDEIGRGTQSIQQATNPAPVEEAIEPAIVDEVPEPITEPEPEPITEPEPAPELVAEPEPVVELPPATIPSVDEFVFVQNRPTPRVSAPMVAPEPKRAIGPRNLSKRQYETITAFCDALLPSGGDLTPSASDLGVADRVDAIFGTLDTEVQRRITKMISLIENAPRATKAHRFSKMPAEQASAWIEKALQSRVSQLRNAATTLKSLIANEFASTPTIEQQIGYSYSCETKDSPRDAGVMEVISFETINRNHVEECDVVVVGSGAGGSAVAKELSEAGLSVIVVEEGAYFTRQDFAGPPSERMRRMYRSNGMSTTKGAPSIPLLMGKAVGGTTVVNAGTCVRTPDHVLRRWVKEAGIEGIDPVSMRPIFERVQRTMHVQPTPEEVLGENARIFRTGVQELGLHGLPISRNIAGCRGCGVCTFGCPSDAKQSTNISYLPRAQRAGATIYARCAVRQILVREGRARGVIGELLDDQGVARATLTVRARMVVLSAGAIHTPSLLEANALANRSGMVGRNLRLNPAASVFAIFEEEIYSWRGVQQSYSVDDWHSIDESMIEVTSTIPSAQAGAFPGAGQHLKGLLARLPNVASANVSISDSSSGRVKRSRNGEPQVSYDLNEKDAHAVLLGIGRTSEIFLAAGAKAVCTGVSSFPWIRSSAELQAFREHEAVTSELRLNAFNPAGTARMGSDPATSVVDGWGECHDIKGLFVADASMLPGTPTVNPQITIMAFATRTAAHIARHRASDLN